MNGGGRNRRETEIEGEGVREGKDEGRMEKLRYVRDS